MSPPCNTQFCTSHLQVKAILIGCWWVLGGGWAYRAQLCCMRLQSIPVNHLQFPVWGPYVGQGYLWRPFFLDFVPFSAATTSSERSHLDLRIFFLVQETHMHVHMCVRAHRCIHTQGGRVGGHLGYICLIPFHSTPPSMMRDVGLTKNPNLGVHTLQTP